MVLPVPAFTVLSGGKHASNNFAIQVFKINFIISIAVLPLSDLFFSSFSLAPQSSSRCLWFQVISFTYVMIVVSTYIRKL